MIAASMTYYVGFSFIYYFLLWPLMFEWTIAFPMENRVWIPSKNSWQTNTSDRWDWDINWWHPLVVLFYNQDPDLGGRYYLLLQPPSQSSIWSCFYSQDILHTGKPRLEFLEKCTLIWWWRFWTIASCLKLKTLKLSRRTNLWMCPTQARRPV